MGNQTQLCWDCRRAVGLCPWSRSVGGTLSFTPVPGWTARRVSRVEHEENGKRKMGFSYEITACPLFDPDEDGRRVPVCRRGPARQAVRATCPETGEVRLYSSIADCRRDGFSPKTIHKVLRGERKHHKGWRFARVEE